MPIATPQRQGQTRPKPGAQSHGSSLSSATPASHATKDPTTAELPNGRLGFFALWTERLLASTYPGVQHSAPRRYDETVCDLGPSNSGRCRMRGYDQPYAIRRAWVGWTNRG